MFVAIYLPPLPPNKSQDPSRKGFKTSEDAWEYAFTQMCSMCKKVRANALAGKDKNSKQDWVDGLEPPNLFPSCSCEWEIVDEMEVDPNELENLISIH